MKSINLLVLLTVLFVAPYAFGQISSCPCDTAELPNGNSGNEIVDILCPGGDLAAGNDSILIPDEVEIVRPSGEKLELGYSVSFDGSDLVCSIFEESIGEEGFKLSDEEYEICREGLIRRCNLHSVTNVPTLSEWGGIAMVVVLGMIGLYAAARRRKASA